MIIASFVKTKHRNVTDRQTDRQTDRRTDGSDHGIYSAGIAFSYSDAL